MGDSQPGKGGSTWDALGTGGRLEKKGDSGAGPLLPFPFPPGPTPWLPCLLSRPLLCHHQDHGSLLARRGGQGPPPALPPPRPAPQLEARPALDGPPGPLPPPDAAPPPTLPAELAQQVGGAAEGTGVCGLQPFAVSSRAARLRTQLSGWTPWAWPPPPGEPPSRGGGGGEGSWEPAGLGGPCLSSWTLGAFGAPGPPRAQPHGTPDTCPRKALATAICTQRRLGDQGEGAEPGHDDIAHPRARTRPHPPSPEPQPGAEGAAGPSSPE